MPLLRVVTVWLLAACAAGAANAQDAGLTRAGGDHGAVLVFAPDPEDPRLSLQRRVRAETAQRLAERGILWIEIIRGRGVVREGDPASDLDEGALRAGFGLGAPDFAAGFIGPDGAVKFRATVPVSAEDLLARIEASLPAAENSSPPAAGIAPKSRSEGQSRRDHFDRERRVGPSR